MYDEILKFGAYIVDALRDFNQPAFIYIPPYGELRGGAWVVVDPSINSDMMEMYADSLGCGGILEPEGTVEIKYRAKQLIDAMSRLDPVYADLVQRNTNGEDVSKELKARQELLMPIYKQISIKFAALHDTPGRMLKKGVISKVLEWRSARRYFYWRLLRRLEEEHALKLILETGITRAQALAKLQRWYMLGDGKDYSNDTDVYEWLKANKDQIKANINALQNEKTVHTVNNITDPELAKRVVAELLKNMSKQDQQDVHNALTEILSQ